LKCLVAEHEGFLPDIKVLAFYVSLQIHDNNFTSFSRRFVTRNKKRPSMEGLFLVRRLLKKEPGTRSASVRRFAGE
jgi:hypothetical protein